jgi:hypothetical protein
MYSSRGDGPGLVIRFARFRPAATLPRDGSTQKLIRNVKALHFHGATLNGRPHFYSITGMATAVRSTSNL